MKKIDFLISSVLFLIGALTRFPFAEKIFSQVDGPLYAIAIIRYSFEQITPTFPGYPLYIGLGKFFYIFTQNLQQAILLVSVFGSALGAAIIYLVGKEIFDRKVGLIGAVIFLTGSTFYYFGITTYAYILTPVTSTLLAYATYRVFIKNRQEGLFLGTILGISIGIRPQEAPQVIILFLLGFVFLKKSEKIKAIISLCIISLLWFIPIVNSVGFQQYFNFLLEFKKYNAFAPIIQNIELMTKGFILSFGLSSFFLFYYIFRYWKSWKKEINKNLKIIAFFTAWIIPSVLINLFLRSDHAGYQMTYLSGLLILISYAIWKTTKKNIILYVVFLLIISLFNLFLFFYNRDPNFIKPYRTTSFHYSDIRSNDLKTGSKISFIRSNFNSKKTVIIALPVLWMPYAYYLKDYQVTSLTILDNNIDKSANYEQDVRNWYRKQYKNSDLKFLVPTGITSIVFPDDNAYLWIKDYPYKVQHLPGNSTVTSIYISENSKILYSYHSLRVIK